MCGYGIFVGWLSPTLILTYKNENATTLVTGNLTTEDESWVGSVLSLGTVLGTLIFGSLANCIGTKLSLLLSSVLSIVRFTTFSLSLSEHTQLTEIFLDPLPDRLVVSHYRTLFMAFDSISADGWNCRWLPVRECITVHCRNIGRFVGACAT